MNPDAFYYIEKYFNHADARLKPVRKKWDRDNYN